MRWVMVIGALCGFLWSSGARGAPRYKEPAEMKAQFVEIEKIARLPAEEQKKQLPRLYRELSDGLRSFFVEAILSVHFETFVTDGPTAHPFNAGAPFDERRAGPRTPEDYATDIDEVASKMTPDEVADAILRKRGNLALRIGARRRCMQALVANVPTLRPLIAEDLKSDKPADIRRALETITDLRLADFTDDVLKIYLEDQRKEVRVFATSALWVLNNDQIVARLVKEVEAAPATLPAHQQMLSLVLRSRKAPPPILKLLDSPQPATRAAAADVLTFCVDEALIPHVRRLAKSDDPKLRAIAATMGCAQGLDGFATLHAMLLPLLKDEQIEVRCAAAIGFAEFRDIAAAQTLLELWSDGTVPMAHQIAINSAVQKLTGDTWGYQPGHWGMEQEENRKAMDRFQEWIAKNQPKP